LPPASLQAAASVPISSLPFRTGAASTQASVTSAASRPAAAGSARAKEDPAKTNAPGESESADSSSGKSTPEQAFADIIRQLSSEASAPVPQSAATNANQGLFRGWQAVQAAPTTPVTTTPLTTAPATTEPLMAALAAPVIEKKQATNTPVDSKDHTPVAPKDHTQDVRPVLIDVVTPLMPVKPKLAELSAGGGVSEAELKPRAVHAAPLQPEAALTVVIHNDIHNDAQAAPQAPKIAEYSGDQTEFAASTPPPTVAGPDAPAVSASATPDSTAPATTMAQIAGYEIVAAPEHRKAAGGTAAIAPDASAVKSAAPQATAFQDLQLKGEPMKNDNAGPRAAVPTAPTAPPERVAPEKSAAPPVKSVALEFTPDGTRDVKVRLSERGGEVHVSVHSTDPAVTKDLRAGVTDLASVLERAGYDAKAWAGDRQQQGNPQQQEQQSPQRRNSKSGEGAEQFESILQQPNQENS